MTLQGEGKSKGETVDDPSSKKNWETGRIGPGNVSFSRRRRKSIRDLRLFYSSHIGELWCLVLVWTVWSLGGLSFRGGWWTLFPEFYAGC